MSDYTPTTEEVFHCYQYCSIVDAPESAHEAEPQFERWLAELKAQTITDAIAYLKTTPAVTLTGNGGGYELLEAYKGESK